MNQLRSLLSLVGLLEEDISVNQPSQKQDEYNYLENGERILSLARIKKKRTLFKSDDLTVRLNDLKFPILDVSFEKALRQIENTIKKEIRNNLKQGKAREYLNQISIPFLLRLCPDTTALVISEAAASYEKSLAESVSNSEFILKVVVNNIDFYVPAVPRKRFSDSSYYFKQNKYRTINMYHADKLFYQLFLLRWIYEMKSISRIDHSVKEMLHSITSQITYDFLLYDWELNELPKWMCSYLLDNHFELYNSSCYIKANRISNHQKVVKFKDMFDYNDGRFLLIFFLYSEDDIPLLEVLRSNDEYPSFHVPQEITQLALQTLHYFISNEQDTQVEEQHRKKLEGIAARAYTTKRNIPDHILHEMRISELNDYFGFIEFDEDVDLALVASVIEEFKKINHSIFHDYSNKNVAFRFRKLGRHHATGLYYPSISTMVVDFRYPTSFIHEYFHMLDDELGNLSLNYDFSKIVSRYQYLLEKEIDKDRNGQKVIHLSGKYNLKYYLRKCEIFARCGEIHLFRNLHVVSSLLKPEETKYFCYPDDPELNHLIDDYYSNMLQRLSENAFTGKEEPYEKNLRIADH